MPSITCLGHYAITSLAALLCLGAGGCGRTEAEMPRFASVEGGDAKRGQALLARYQCGSCHVIPEVPSAAGRSAPTLAAFGQRSYIAGQAPNLPHNLVRWLQDPPALVPGARMPDMGVTEADARDMAAYLLTLR